MTREAEPWRILARGEGRWRGREEMPPAPWAPEGLRSSGTMDARLVLGGRGLSSDYVQVQAGGQEMRSHTLIRWHADEEVFLLEFSNETGPKPMLLRGERSGDSVVFEGPGPGGAPMRQTMTWSEDRIAVRSESPDGEGGWSRTFSGEYHRSESAPVPGTIGWHDLTVDEAPEVRDFYMDLIGWRTDPVDMGDYSDWNVLDAEGDVVAGICHRRGPNAALPPAWLMYVRVDGLDGRLERVETMGGRVIKGPRGPDGRYRTAVIEDPAGAVLALYEIGGAD